jgi:hypothetical protein
MVGKVKFEARIKELVENQPDLAELVEPLLMRHIGKTSLYLATRPLLS